jgi:cell division protein FtsA
MNDRRSISVTRNRPVRRPDLERVLEVTQYTKIPGDRKSLQVIPPAYAVDGNDSAGNQVGMFGSRLDIQTHIITAAEASIQNLTRCIRSTGVKVDDLVLEPLASAEAVLTSE